MNFVSIASGTNVDQKEIWMKRALGLSRKSGRSLHTTINLVNLPSACEHQQIQITGPVILIIIENNMQSISSDGANTNSDLACFCNIQSIHGCFDQRVSAQTFTSHIVYIIVLQIVTKTRKTV
jgi:hypothetical protein